MNDDENRILGLDPTTGIAMVDVEWLDIHFEACVSEYRAMLNKIGIQRGWSVLDAACGPGHFLEWIGELVGENGNVIGLDLSQHLVDIALERQINKPQDGYIKLQQGDIRNLPFENTSLDLIWFANTAQYLSDDELNSVLAEFFRVLKPGGIVAIKDVDLDHRIHPGPVFLFAHLFDRISKLDVPLSLTARGFQRTYLLRRWLEKAGFVDVTQETYNIDHWAPLSDVKQAWITNVLKVFRSTTNNLNLPGIEMDFWERLQDPIEMQKIINNPEFYYREPNTVAIGTRPR